MVAEHLDPVAVLLFCASESWWLVILSFLPVIGLLSRTRSIEAEERWARLVRKTHRIRRLQRYFAFIGIHLRDNFPKGLKERLKQD